MSHVPLPRHALRIFTISLAGLASGAAAQIEYDAIIIEPWDETYSLRTSRAAGINNHNVVSGCATPLSGSCSFLWTLEGGKTQVNLGGAINDLGYIAGGSGIRTPDGEIILMEGVGSARDLNNANEVAGAVTGRYWGGCRYTRYATVWDEELGGRSLVTTFGVPAAHESRAINDLGQIVGVRSTTGSCGDFEAFYLDTHTGEHIDIHAELLGGQMGLTEAFDINNDGVVIGSGPVENQVRGFVWHRDDGFVLLPDLPGTVPSYSEPSHINNHGVVVGEGIVADDWRAWIWDETNGIRDLNVISAGLPADFTIDGSDGINDNGWIIASGHFGTWSPERAVVLIPRGSECVADFNDDGILDIFDVSSFLGAFTAQDPSADLVPDGLFDVFDVTEFLGLFSAGCS